MKALYTAATGMHAQQTRIDNIANNLANVSTTGFKKSRASFEDLVYQTQAIGAGEAGAQRANMLQIGSGVRVDGTVRDMGAGDLKATSNPLDMAITGRGYFVLESPEGVEKYTRDGQFQVNSEGSLVGSSGYAVSPGIEIPDDIAEVTVDADGTVIGRYADATQEVILGTLQLVEFTNPAGLRAVGGNMYQATPESGEAFELDTTDGTTGVQQYALESSNVDVAEELVDMISAQRAYELTSKAIQAADEALGVVNGLKR